jgi:hypothetical protein
MAEEVSSAAPAPAAVSTPNPTMTPVPAEAPGSGAIQPGQETAGTGGYSGVDGTTGYSNPSVGETEDDHASLSPLIIAGEVALGATGVGAIVEGAAMLAGVALETAESVEHFGEGAGVPTAPAAPEAPAAPAAPVAPESTAAGMSGTTSDGAGYSTVGPEPVSSSTSSFTEEAEAATVNEETVETLNESAVEVNEGAETALPVDDFSSVPDGVGPIADVQYEPANQEFRG